jgi:glutaconate CoA-transferase subunit B
MNASVMEQTRVGVSAIVPRADVMVAAIAAELRDGDHAFIGLGTGGRAFVNAVGIPSVAIELARRAWDLDLVAQYGVLFEPDLSQTPRSFADPYLLRWPGAANVPVDVCLDQFRRGKISVSFISGVQIDPFGNLNSVVIGDHDRPQVRLTGPIAQTDHAAYAGRTVIVLPHERRTFVNRVDFVSAVGYGDGPGFRERHGLLGGGPALVVTELATLRFVPETKRMFLASIHPGVSLEEVLASTGFDLDFPEAVPVTPAPTESETRLIQEIGPEGLWLNARIR